MSALTREQIENIRLKVVSWIPTRVAELDRKKFTNDPTTALEEFNALCDMALRSLYVSPSATEATLEAERAEVDRLLARFEGAFRDSGDHVQQTTMRAIRAAHRQRYAKLDLPITPQPITPRTHHG